MPLTFNRLLSVLMTLTILCVSQAGFYRIIFLDDWRLEVVILTAAGLIAVAIQGVTRAIDESNG
jgi:hypothetical protein